MGCLCFKGELTLMQKDIFICHASEDKSSVVRPLISSLNESGLSYWVDELEIALGESITERVNDGLKVSDYVVVVLSRAFMSKNWAKKELWSVLNLEIKKDKVIVLPILVGSEPEVAGIIEEFPLLNEKLFIIWNGDSKRVAIEIFNSIRKHRGEPQIKQEDMHNCGHCHTPFQHGVYVCLGCQGTIVYGMTSTEKLEIRRITIVLLGLLSLVSMFIFPSYSISLFGFQLPMMWGIGFEAIPIAFVITFIAAFYIEYKVARHKAYLVRTFR